jgi:hypothetical protein
MVQGFSLPQSPNNEKRVTENLGSTGKFAQQKTAGDACGFLRHKDQPNDSCG